MVSQEERTLQERQDGSFDDEQEVFDGVYTVK